MFYLKTRLSTDFPAGYVGCCRGIIYEQSWATNQRPSRTSGPRKDAIMVSLFVSLPSEHKGTSIADNSRKKVKTGPGYENCYRAREVRGSWPQNYNCQSFQTLQLLNATLEPFGLLQPQEIPTIRGESSKSRSYLRIASQLLFSSLPWKCKTSVIQNPTEEVLNPHYCIYRTTSLVGTFNLDMIMNFW